MDTACGRGGGHERGHGRGVPGGRARAGVRRGGGFFGRGGFFFKIFFLGFSGKKRGAGVGLGFFCFPAGLSVGGRAPPGGSTPHRKLGPRRGGGGEGGGGPKKHPTNLFALGDYVRKKTPIVRKSNTAFGFPGGWGRFLWKKQKKKKNPGFFCFCAQGPQNLRGFRRAGGGPAAFSLARGGKTSNGGFFLGRSGRTTWLGWISVGGGHGGAGFSFFLLFFCAVNPRGLRPGAGGAPKQAAKDEGFSRVFPGSGPPPRGGARGLFFPVPHGALNRFRAMGHGTQAGGGLNFGTVTTAGGFRTGGFSDKRGRWNLCGGGGGAVPKGADLAGRGIPGNGGEGNGGRTEFFPRNAFFSGNNPFRGPQRGENDFFPRQKKKKKKK